MGTLSSTLSNFQKLKEILSKEQRETFFIDFNQLCSNMLMGYSQEDIRSKHYLFQTLVSLSMYKNLIAYTDHQELDQITYKFADEFVYLILNINKVLDKCKSQKEEWRNYCESFQKKYPVILNLTDLNPQKIRKFTVMTCQNPLKIQFNYDKRD